MLRALLFVALLMFACAPGPGRAPDPYRPPSDLDPPDAGFTRPAPYDSGLVAPLPDSGTQPSVEPDTGSGVIFLDSGTTSDPDTGTMIPETHPDASTIGGRDANTLPPIPDAGARWDAGSLPAVDPMLIARLQDALFDTRNDLQTLGAGLGLLAPNVGMWTGTAGSILPGGTPLSATDKFQVGSVTKTFTAALILQLVEQGALQLDAPISTWFPTFPNAGSITVRQLLNHTSGLVDYLQDQSLNIHQPSTHEALLNYPAAQPLLFTPGSEHSYSNTNYILLGLIIEQVTNSTYLTQLRTRLLEPLGLTHTYLNGEEVIPGGYAPGVYINNRNFVLTNEQHASLAWSAGAIVSSMVDVMHWFLALGGGVVLQPATLSEMLSGGVQIPNTTGYYGLGMMWENSDRGPVFFHDGIINDSSTVLAYIPDINLIVVAYANTYMANPFAIMNTAIEIVAP